MGCGNMKNISRTALNQNVNLIPFLSRSSDSEPGLFGYMDEETGEIVIEAQYYDAGPFIGDFAVVLDKKPKIINRDNTQIRVGRFDEAYLFASENGKTTIAVLQITEEKTKIVPPWWWWFAILVGSELTYKETIFKQRLVNLTTGKTIIPQKEQLIENDIQVIGEYFCIVRELYRFLDNGEVQCVADDKNDATQAIAILNAYFEQRGINAIVKDRYGIRIDYDPYIAEIYADPDFTGAFEKLRPDFTIPFQRAYGLYRDPTKYLNTSIEISGDRRYVMRFQRDEPYASAEGIYNETRKEWELKPYLFNFDDEQYIIYDIRQTNNPHVFELNMKKVPPHPVFHYSTVIHTTSEKPMRYKVRDTNDRNNAYPFRGGVYCYIDLTQNR